MNLSTGQMYTVMQQRLIVAYRYVSKGCVVVQL